jgi:hypothetical protein
MEGAVTVNWGIFVSAKAQSLFYSFTICYLKKKNHRENLEPVTCRTLVLPLVTRWIEGKWYIYIGNQHILGSSSFLEKDTYRKPQKESKG